MGKDVRSWLDESDDEGKGPKRPEGRVEKARAELARRSSKEARSTREMKQPESHEGRESPPKESPGKAAARKADAGLPTRMPQARPTPVHPTFVRKDGPGFYPALRVPEPSSQVWRNDPLKLAQSLEERKAFAGQWRPSHREMRPPSSEVSKTEAWACVPFACCKMLRQKEARAQCKVEGKAQGAQREAKGQATESAQPLPAELQSTSSSSQRAQQASGLNVRRRAEVQRPLLDARRRKQQHADAARRASLRPVQEELRAAVEAPELLSALHGPPNVTRLFAGMRAKERVQSG